MGRDQTSRPDESTGRVLIRSRLNRPVGRVSMLRRGWPQGSAMAAVAPWLVTVSLAASLGCQSGRSQRSEPQATARNDGRPGSPGLGTRARLAAYTHAHMHARPDIHTHTSMLQKYTQTRMHTHTPTPTNTCYTYTSGIATRGPLGARVPSFTCPDRFSDCLRK